MNQLLVNPPHKNDLNDAPNWTFYLVSLYSTGVISIIVEALTIRSIQVGSKIKLPIKLLACYIAFNVCSILTILLYGPVDKVLDGKAEMTSLVWFLAVMSCLFYILSMCAFNVSTWYFGYKYFRCAEKTKYVYYHQKIPNKVQKCHKTLFRTLFVLNILIPTLLGVLAFVRTVQDYENKGTTKRTF